MNQHQQDYQVSSPETLRRAKAVISQINKSGDWQVLKPTTENLTNLIRKWHLNTAAGWRKAIEFFRNKDQGVLVEYYNQ